MKRILLLLTLFIGLQVANAQYVTIPDQSFRIYLKTAHPSCFDSLDRLDTTCTSLLTTTSLFFPINEGFFSIEGIQYLKKLRTLTINSNDIIALPVLPDSLRELDFALCRVSTITMLPAKLESLKFNSNLVTALPSLPSTLLYMDCQGNRLTSLPALPNRMTYLNCHYNQLTNLPVLPNVLQFLKCTSNNLTALPLLPNTLTTLYCEENKLISLPALSSSLRDFNCRINNLTELPKLPNSLLYLTCTFNQLTTLPVLPNLLEDLYCDNNQLVSIPALPSSLIALSCYNNKIEALPALPNSLQHLACSNNPLKCLPLLPINLSSLYVKNTNVFCIPNINPILIGHTDTILPVCTNASDICDVNPFVQGKVYYDANDNGVYNNGEELLPQQIVKVLPNNWLGASDANGNYIVKLDTAVSNTWSAANNYRYATITPASYTLSNIHNLGLQSGSYDFGVHIIPNVKDLETTLGSSPARPGFTANVTVTTNNIGTVNQSNITIKLKKPSGFDVLATSIAPTSISNDTLIWNNISIDYLEHQSISIELQMPVDAVLGDSAVYEAWSNGTEGDTTPLDNYATWTEVIRGSFDPNDKLVNPSTLPPTYNADTDRLLYTIRFQNTGTDAAFTVIVRDEIPNNLDVSSLRVVNASHKYQLIVREKNIVEVAFPNIMLPDSNTNEAKSHGFVQLEFKPKAGLPVNADINNTASIFFDYNLPVITNTATTKIQLILGTASNRKLNFKLFPNPTSSSIKIELPYNGNGNWYLTDISGNRIKQNSIENNTDAFDINVADVASGTYLLTLEMNGTVSTSKVVIVR
jgi:hypothetical protein